MSLRSICNREVVTIGRKSTLKDVSNLMNQKHVGSILVIEQMNGNKVPAGIITDRDLALTMSSTEKPQMLLVEQIMQSQPVLAKVDDGIFETIEKMHKYGVKRLPVVDEKGSLYGIISADDLLTFMGEEINNLGKIRETQISHEKGIRMPSEKNFHM